MTILTGGLGFAPYALVTGGLAPSVPVSTQAPYRDADVLDAFRAALDATGAFDAVLDALPEEQGESSEYEALAAITPVPGGARQTQDFVDSGGILNTRRSRYVLTLIVRDEDAGVRNRRLDLLQNIAHNALDGVSVGGMTIPAWTRLDDWGYLKATDPERRVQANGGFAYQVYDGAHAVNY